MEFLLKSSKLQESYGKFMDSCPYKVRGTNEWMGCFNMVHGNCIFAGLVHIFSELNYHTISGNYENSTIVRFLILFKVCRETCAFWIRQIPFAFEFELPIVLGKSSFRFHFPFIVQFLPLWSMDDKRKWNQNLLSPSTITILSGKTQSNGRMAIW